MTADGSISKLPWKQMDAAIQQAISLCCWRVLRRSTLQLVVFHEKQIFDNMWV